MKFKHINIINCRNLTIGICVFLHVHFGCVIGESEVQVDFPEPAPSYLSIKLSNPDIASLSIEAKFERFDKDHLIISNQSSATKIYMSGEKFIAGLKYKPVHDDTVDMEIHVEIDPDLAKGMIGLWADWLSYSRYKKEAGEEQQLLFYAASRNVGGRIYEGVFLDKVGSSKFSQRMLSTTRRFNVLVTNLNLLSGAEIQIPITKDELSKITREIKSEILKEISDLQRILDNIVELNYDTNY